MTITNYDTDDLVNYNKTYIPEDYINQNWTYTFNGDDIVIITNQNCTQNYNTTYCNCYTYNTKQNLISNSYSCSTNTNNSKIINKQYITDDIYFSNRAMNVFYNEKIIGIGTIILAILFATFLLKERKCL